MGTEAESVRSAMPMDLERGVCYLVKEKKPELSYRLFETLVAAKIPGLCITRQYPERVRRGRGRARGPALRLRPTTGAGFPHPTPRGRRPQGSPKVVRAEKRRGGGRPPRLPQLHLHQ